MKARRKSDGKIIEVREWRGVSDVIYSSPDMNQFYQASELDFNVDAKSQCMNLSDVKQKIDEWMNNHTEEEVYKLLKKHGVIEDADDTVISGWVARDKGRFLGLYPLQPQRGDVAWLCGSCMVLPINTFPDLTWESDPLEVEIILKRKKNG